jgi:hypothetical protein
MDWILDLLTNLYTPLGTASNYSAIANLHTIQIATAPAKPFPAYYVLTSLSLATAVVSRPCRTLVNCQLSIAFLAELNCTANPQLTHCHPFSIIRLAAMFTPTS